jgi:hypothetical protein
MLHTRHEGLIIKGVSMGQNIAVRRHLTSAQSGQRTDLMVRQVSDETHAILRDQGAFLEEPITPSTSPHDTDLNEKIEYFPPDALSSPVDIVVPPRTVDQNDRGVGMSYDSSISDPNRRGHDLR